VILFKLNGDKSINFFSITGIIYVNKLGQLKRKLSRSKGWVWRARLTGRAGVFVYKRKSGL